MSKPNFSDLETDATIELINQGVGRACDALAKLLNQEVFLSVPDIQFVDFHQLLEQLQSIDNNRSIVVVSQHYQGDFSGDALLVFPEQCSELLVQQMLAELTIDADPLVLQKDTLIEIGNIILNACFGQLGDLLSTQFDCDYPKYTIGSVEDSLSQLNGNFNRQCKNRCVMFLQVNFIVHSISIRGSLAFVMDESSMTSFQNKVKRYLKSLFN